MANYPEQQPNLKEDWNPNLSTVAQDHNGDGHIRPAQEINAIGAELGTEPKSPSLVTPAAEATTVKMLLGMFKQAIKNITGGANWYDEPVTNLTAVGSAIAEKPSTAEVEALIAAAKEALYPIGTTYINADDDTNPADLLGFGTWAYIAKGRTLVGVDVDDPDLEESGMELGEKEHTLTVGELAEHTHIQEEHNHTQNSHNHTQNSHNHTQNAHDHVNNTNNWGQLNLVASGSGGAGWQGTGTAMRTASATATNQATTATNQATTATNQATTAVNQVTGDNEAHNNMQPSLTVYIWKRTA